jgi:hypothetical protein
MRAMVAAGALLLAGLPPGAAAHSGSPPDTLDVLVDPAGGPALAIEATIGLVVARDGENYHWICHEAVLPGGSPRMVRYRWTEEGVTFALPRVLGLGILPAESLYRSSDGCDWPAVEGLTGKLVWDLAVDPADSSHLLAITTNSEAAAVNAVYLSVDAGASWQPTELELTGIAFRSIVWAPAHADEIWISAARPSSDEAFVYRSHDGGHSWDELPFDVEIDGQRRTRVDIVAVSPDDPAVAWAAVAVDGAVHLLRTTDGGEGWSALVVLTDGLLDMEVDGQGGAWIVDGTGQLHWAPDSVTFEPVSAPRMNGLALRGDALLAAVAFLDEGYALGVAEGGLGSWTRAFTFGDMLGLPDCGADSDVVVLCEPYWRPLAIQFGILEPETGEPPGDDPPAGQCACRSTGTGAPPWSLLLWALPLVLGGRPRGRRGES